jgi:hypothetical protein
MGTPERRSRRQRMKDIAHGAQADDQNSQVTMLAIGGQFLIFSRRS